MKRTAHISTGSIFSAARHCHSLGLLLAGLIFVTVAPSALSAFVGTHLTAVLLA
jgi:hypothetical protein